LRVYHGSSEISPLGGVSHLRFYTLLAVNTESGGSNCRVQGLGFRVEDLGFRVQGSGLRVKGSGFRV